MTTPRVRLTIRRLLIVIAGLALLLAGYVKIRDKRRREALILQLRMETVWNEDAQTRLRADADLTRQKHDSGYASRDELRSKWERMDQLRKHRQALETRIARLARDL